MFLKKSKDNKKKKNKNAFNARRKKQNVCNEKRRKKKDSRKKKKSKKTLTEAQPNGNEATEPEQTAPAPTTRSGRVVKKTLVALEHEETEREFRRSV